MRRVRRCGWRQGCSPSACVRESGVLAFAAGAGVTNAFLGAAAERLRLATLRLKAAYLRQLHADWTDEEIQREVRRAFMYVHD